MEHEIKKEAARGSDVLPIECPVGCGFFIVCWLVSAEEVCEEVIWFCLGRMKKTPLEDVPIGVWAYRPEMSNEFELGNW